MRVLRVLDGLGVLVGDAMIAFIARPSSRPGHVPGHGTRTIWENGEPFYVLPPPYALPGGGDLDGADVDSRWLA